MPWLAFQDILTATVGLPTHIPSRKLNSHSAMEHAQESSAKHTNTQNTTTHQVPIRMGNISVYLQFHLSAQDVLATHPFLVDPRGGKKMLRGHSQQDFLHIQGVMNPSQWVVL